MFPFPTNLGPIYLQMGLTHPIFGPVNLFWYSAFQGYACYLAWVDMLTDPMRKGEWNRPLR